MIKLLHSSLFLAYFLFSLGVVFAGEMPFTDIQTTDPYYDAVQSLYDSYIITDNGDHLFHPDNLMTRDFFVGLSVQIGCHRCDTPSIVDIVKYRAAPFVDLTKINPHYYCIAYAKDENITQGYVIDTSGKATCENAIQYTSSPFCADNTITRIEATGILLRRAKLWDDIRNSGNFDKSMVIPDTTSYWYGYAKKGIDIGILKQQSDKKIGQDEKITRGEFALMANRILGYTQCQSENSNNTMASSISIQDINNNTIERSDFGTGEVLWLVPKTSSGTWLYKWNAIDPNTGKMATGNGSRFSGAQLGSGNWIVTLNIIDPLTTRVISSPTISINLGSAANTITQPSGNPSVLLSADTLIANIGTSVGFTATVSGNKSNQTYNWNYGDGIISNTIGNTSHIYTAPGIYTITLTITDMVTKKTVQSTLIMSVVGDIDTDGDGIIDTEDQCRLVYSVTATGCPTISIYSGNRGTGNGNSSINTSAGYFDTNNICLSKRNKNQGLLIGKPNCIQCPCINSISISSAIRSCDIVFPTILSPNLDTVYSRGAFFVIP